MRKTAIGLAVAAALAATPALAAIDTYTAFLYGANEVPGPGDPDGYGVATLLIDNVADTISWSFMALNIDMPLTAAHIHTGGFGVAGPPIVDFGGAMTGSDMFDTDLASINPANAGGFYVNLHTSAYPGGAIRGQMQYVGTAAPPPPIPEPATYGMMLAGLGLVGWLGRRRRED